MFRKLWRVIKDAFFTSQYFDAAAAVCRGRRIPIPAVPLPPNPEDAEPGKLYRVPAGWTPNVPRPAGAEPLEIKPSAPIRLTRIIADGGKSITLTAEAWTQDECIAGLEAMQDHFRLDNRNPPDPFPTPDPSEGESSERGKP